MNDPADGVDGSALTPERLLRRLEWTVIRRLDGRLQGDYRTLLRGHGIEFTDLREYVPTDESRYIDWNVTARMDTPYVRQFLEERDVTAWLVLDRSPSMDFGPVQRRKDRVLVEVAATMAQLLARAGNRVGAICFDHRVRERIPPAHGRRQVLRIISSAQGRTAAMRGAPDASPDGAHPAGPGTDLAVPLLQLANLARRRSLVLVISDFISTPGWERALSGLGRRHEVVMLRITDPREFDLPAVGMVYVEDPETGEQLLIDTDDAQFRARLAAVAAEREEALRAAAASAGAELYSVSTEEDLVSALVRVAALRARTARANPAAGGAR